MQATPNPFEQIFQRLEFLESQLANLPKPTTTDLQPEILDLDALVSYIGNVSKASIYRWMHLRHIPYFKLGRRAYFRRTEIEKWMKTHRHRTIAEAVDSLTAKR